MDGLALPPVVEAIARKPKNLKPTMKLKVQHNEEIHAVAAYLESAHVPWAPDFVDNIARRTKARDAWHKLGRELQVARERNGYEAAFGERYAGPLSHASVLRGLLHIPTSASSPDLSAKLKEQQGGSSNAASTPTADHASLLAVEAVERQPQRGLRSRLVGAPVDSALRVFHTAHNADCTERTQRRNTAFEVALSAIPALTDVRPLPATRPKLTPLRLRAADSFDAQHCERTEQACATLRALSHASLGEQSGRSVFAKQLQEVRWSRYLGVDEDSPQVVHVAKARKGAKKWSLFDSIWSARATTSDGRDFYDTPHVKRMTFDQDWSIACAKYALEKKLERAAKKLPTAEAGQCTMLAMKESACRHFDCIYQMFAVYSAIGSGDDVFAVSKQAFTQMIADCALADEDAVGLRGADLNILFEGVNAKATKGERFNHKKTLNREQWLGILTQIVLLRHVASDDGVGVSTAFDAFFDELRLRLPDAVYHDANSFRSDFCYCEATDLALGQYGASLRLIYDIFAHGTGAIGDNVYSTKLMDIGEYNMLIDRLELVDEHLTAREVAQTFVYSRLLVVDEQSVKGRSKLVQLRFEDFLEAVVRLAYMKALPTAEEIAQQGFRHAGEFLVDLEAEPARYDEFQTARTRTFGDTLEQPIANKVGHFLAWVVFRVRGGVESKKDLTKKEVEGFRRGGIALQPRARADGEREATGNESANADPDAEENVEFVRKAGGPETLEHDSGSRSALVKEGRGQR